MDISTLVITTAIGIISTVVGALYINLKERVKAVEEANKSIVEKQEAFKDEFGKKLDGINTAVSNLDKKIDVFIAKSDLRK